MRARAIVSAVAVTILTVGAVGVVVWCFGRKGDIPSEGGAVSLRVPANQEMPKLSGGLSKKIGMLPCVRPSALADSVGTGASGTQKGAQESSDEKLVDEVVSGLMDLLAEALAKKDYASLDKILSKLRSIRFGELAGRRGAGRLAKQRILELLEGAGNAGLANVLDFLRDQDPEVAHSAEEIILKRLRDRHMSDFDRAEIVTEAAKEMESIDALNRLFNEFSKMRHSVGTTALVDILSSGTDQAKQVLPRVMKAFTGDSSMETVQQLKEWMENNPDSYLDDWYYGKKSLESVQAESR